MKKALLYIFISLLCCFSITLSLNECIKFQERKNLRVEINQSKPIMFYEDTCSDCKRIFPIIFLYSKFHNIQLVNLNGVQNKKYINEYNLKYVPTFINENKHYSGTDLTYILELLK